ncbi:spermidine synthase [Exophiala mesophila]|uniref:Spermidine synthase n=1 Tax=Exophiala mesophila TaxID=212818 RepID=A0A0D1ZV73_EXOME|nr:spermidine synthase [Exophiala mesophila]KIV97879.1 spermidine synthase [Exophiala mesophila]
MSEITHPTIKDGWFREISDMWPGQAMILKVNQVLHHEKSKYQDVLVFESSDHGTVLVLDNVIQCTERDEFSYQEMITHLAMNSHPNPKSVLVIGGGDGGVLREVVKHETVEKAILCDIDEAVIRVSKKYLPGMSIGYQHPAVETFIGDGFKFLADRKDEFDVIITDSSDPEGPAESLFQKPYFELLYGALKEGGVITTQGCALPSSPPTIVVDEQLCSSLPYSNCDNHVLTCVSLQLKTNGFTFHSSPSSRKIARKSSPSSNTPTPPSPPILPARLDSWFVARTPLATSRSLSAHGPPRRKRSCADTTTRRSTKPASSCPLLPASTSTKHANSYMGPDTDSKPLN